MTSRPGVDALQHLLAGAIGLAVAAALAGCAANPEPSPTVTVEVPMPGPTVTVTETAEPTGSSGQPKYGPGMYIVGDDIAPGRYRTTEALSDPDSLPCRVTVEDEASDYFESAQIVTGRLVIDVADIDGAIVDVGSPCDYPLALVD